MPKLIKDLATYGAADFFSKFMGLLFAPILTRLLLPEQYGAGPLLMAFWTPLTAVAYGGADWAYPYLKAEDKNGERNHELVVTASMISMVSVLIVWSCFALFGFTGWLQKQTMTGDLEIALFLMMLLPSTLTNWFLNPLRYMQKPGSYARVSLIGQVLSVVLAIPFLYMVTQSQRLSVLWGVGAIVQLVAFGWSLREMSRCGVWPFSKQQISFVLARTMFRYGTMLVPSALLYLCVNITDRLLVGWYLGPDQVAFLQLAISLGGISTMLAGWFFMAFDPHVIEWVATKDAKIYEPKLQLSLKLLTVFFFFLACGVDVWGNWVVRLLFPLEYFQTAKFLPILTLCTAFNTVSRIGLTSAIIAQSPKYRLFVNLSALIINVSIGILTIPRIGVMGALLGTLAAEIYMLLSWIVIGKHKIANLNLNWGMTLLVGFASGLFILCYQPSDNWTTHSAAKAGIISIGLIFSAVVLLRLSLGKEVFNQFAKNSSGFFIRRKD